MEAMIGMKVSAADGCSGDSDDGVLGHLDGWTRHVPYCYFEGLSLPYDSAHGFFRGMVISRHVFLCTKHLGMGRCLIADYWQPNLG